MNVNHTSIKIHHPVLGAIHVTECQNVTFMDGIQAQQLRLHQSQDLHCDNIHIHAGTILEDCQRITFHVPSSSSSSTTTNLSELRKNIKDFNWLKNGIASPNFSIQIYNATNTTAITEARMLIDNDNDGPPTSVIRNDPSIDLVSVELSDLSSYHNNNSVPEYNDNRYDDDDDEI